MRGNGIEFLLVQSRGGRWIFPKGGIESGLTHAQSAALEAFEEAGVHGRIEEISFARYIRRERGGAQSSAKPARDTLVHAYLCEVRRLGRPQELNRNRTWFTAQKAKRRLQEDRAEDFGAELARVVDRALSRIQRLQRPARSTAERTHRDALHKARFEGFEDGRFRGDPRQAALARYFPRPRPDPQPHKVLQSGAPEAIRRPVLRLGAGTAPAITAIDSGRGTNLSKPKHSPSRKHKAPGSLV